jgi:hypothetical protein
VCAFPPRHGHVQRRHRPRARQVRAAVHVTRACRALAQATQWRRISGPGAAAAGWRRARGLRGAVGSTKRTPGRVEGQARRACERQRRVCPSASPRTVLDRLRREHTRASPHTTTHSIDCDGSTPAPPLTRPPTRSTRPPGPRRRPGAA